MNIRYLLRPTYVYENRALIKPAAIKFMKLIVAPFLRWAALKGFPLDSNSRQLLRMKDLHKGKRGFVIGNGPSLRMDDLSKLTSEITIASNKIYLAFDKTSWRPTYYSIIDGLVAKNIAVEVAELSMPKFFPVHSELSNAGEEILLCRLLTDWYSPSHFEPGFSDNLITGIYAGESVTYWNIQVLWYLGIREIYLVGVDHSFTLPAIKLPDADFEYLLVSDGEKNHFDDRYRPVNEVWTMPHLDAQAASYAYALEYIQNNGGFLKNASRKTELKCLEIVDFDSLF